MGERVFCLFFRNLVSWVRFHNSIFVLSWWQLIYLAKCKNQKCRFIAKTIIFKKRLNESMFYILLYLVMTDFKIGYCGCTILEKSLTIVSNIGKCNKRTFISNSIHWRNITDEISCDKTTNYICRSQLYTQRYSSI